MIERECDCSDRHMMFPDFDVSYEMMYPPSHPRVMRPIPALHKHEDERCSKEHLGVSGCPGLPHCRDWIIGSYNAGIAIANVTGDEMRAFDLRIQRDGLEREFSLRKQLSVTEVRSP